MMYFVRFVLPALIWAIIIFLFSSHPTGTASQADWQDFSIKKFAHMAEFAIFTVLYFRLFLNLPAQADSKFSRKKSIKYAFVLAVLYGISDEIHQRFTPGRESALRDVIFDTIGASLASIYLWKYLPTAPKPLKRLAANFQLILPSRVGSKEGK